MQNPTTAMEIALLPFKRSRSRKMRLGDNEKLLVDMSALLLTLPHSILRSTSALRVTGCVSWITSLNTFISYSVKRVLPPAHSACCLGQSAPTTTSLSAHGCYGPVWGSTQWHGRCLPQRPVTSLQPRAIHAFHPPPSCRLKPRAHSGVRHPQQGEWCTQS